MTEFMGRSVRALQSEVNCPSKSLVSTVHLKAMLLHLASVEKALAEKSQKVLRQHGYFMGLIEKALEAETLAEAQLILSEAL